MRSICLFCGSGAGRDPAFTGLARETGRLIARAGLRLVYGGAENGLMGEAARAALAEGGQVLGVIPEFLIPLEGAQEGVELRITATLASRKAMLMSEADAFLILPGGAGTLEEVFDMIMQRQHSLHAKPAAFVGADFWSPLEALLAHVGEAGFADAGVLEGLSFHHDPQSALNTLTAMTAEASAANAGARAPS
ncbi:TIGR00730 family Rossman fold protein [Alkalicaulis satelles]|uniref:Cytokinin riboside 5'-monophosphate phosphoribohydrolase n=1 Tax=Alkalicaulis satelles TaxID=2609175 RepID=A0A5M6ZIE3_9PROT|nr:TIGR00730 family Rossman fold protein [Alkalicaulis satelles]KAA5804606.1 TIGR00730 family Rossman fold protein [Alkalicaulis satelles]